MPKTKQTNNNEADQQTNNTNRKKHLDFLLCSESGGNGWDDNVLLMRVAKLRGRPEIQTKSRHNKYHPTSKPSPTRFDIFLQIIIVKCIDIFSEDKMRYKILRYSIINLEWMKHELIKLLDTSIHSLSTKENRISMTGSYLLPAGVVWLDSLSAHPIVISMFRQFWWCECVTEVLGISILEIGCHSKVE